MKCKSKENNTMTPTGHVFWFEWTKSADFTSIIFFILIQTRWWHSPVLCSGNFLQLVNSSKTTFKSALTIRLSYCFTLSTLVINEVIPSYLFALDIRTISLAVDHVKKNILTWHTNLLMYCLCNEATVQRNVRGPNGACFSLQRSSSVNCRPLEKDQKMQSRQSIFCTMPSAVKLETAAGFYYPL